MDEELKKNYLILFPIRSIPTHFLVSFLNSFYYMNARQIIKVFFHFVEIKYIGEI